VEQYERLLQESDLLWAAIDALIKSIPLYSTLIEIPHVGKKAVCGIVAELGDLNDFSHPKQLIRLAGLSISQVSSGKKRGTSQIAKRGRPHLRHWLYIAVLNLLKEKEPSFWALHKYYTTRKDNPLKPMQSVIALCGKLLRVIYGMATTGTGYNPALITSGIPGLNAA
jgi:transposase